MTEAEWIAGTDPRPMLEFLDGKASDRKLRLFACAYCRVIWGLVTRWVEMESAVLCAEQFLEGTMTAARLEQKWVTVSRCYHYLLHPDTAKEPGMAPHRAAILTVAPDARAAAREITSNPAWEADRDLQVALLQCLFGNPFRVAVFPPALPAWRDGLLVSTAGHAYKDRDFAVLPVVADMLEDAGCRDAHILTHCRGPGPHTRGCFVLDHLTGRV